MELIPKFSRYPSHIVNLNTTTEVSGLFRSAAALSSGKELPVCISWLTRRVNSVALVGQVTQLVTALPILYEI